MTVIKFPHHASSRSSIIVTFAANASGRSERLLPFYHTNFATALHAGFDYSITLYSTVILHILPEHHGHNPALDNTVVKYTKQTCIYRLAENTKTQETHQQKVIVNQRGKY